MKETKFYLAADSGGSKTDWAVISDEGETVANVKTKGLGAIKEGLLPVADIVKQAYDALSNYKNVNGLFCSLGGPNVHEVESALKTVWHCPVKVEREANGNALLDAAKMMHCSAVVLCGTGSTAMGDTENGRKFCGGWGPVYGDGGSGGGLCTEALRIFLRSLDGLEPQSRLAEVFGAVTQNLNLKDFNERMEAKRRVCELDRRTLASFAPAIYNLAVEGDPVAKLLYINAAKEIADMAFCVSGNKETERILLCGGFLTKKPFLMEEIQKQFAQKSKATLVHDLNFSPIVAAKAAVFKMGNMHLDENTFKRLMRNGKDMGV